MIKRRSLVAGISLALFGVLGITIPAQASAAGVVPAAQPSSAAVSPDDEREILRLTNAARVARCIPALHRNPAIDTVARNYSKTMSRTGNFAHNPNYFKQMPQSGLRAGAENIAAGYRTGSSMYAGWFDSPGHNANMFNPRYTDIGIGFVTAPHGYGTWGTQNFAEYTHRKSGIYLDVRTGHSFYSEIKWLTDKKITTGYAIKNCGQKAFKPSNTVTREAMAAFLYRYAKDVAKDPTAISYAAPAKAKFSDVPKSHKFYKEISWLEEQEITQGWDDGTFRPQNLISREAMAAFLHRYAGEPNVTNPTTFRDIPKSHKFYEPISWMATRNISTGYGSGATREFRPQNLISREATAAFLSRYDSVR